MNKYYSTTVIYKKIASVISYLKFILLYHLITKNPKPYIIYLTKNNMVNSPPISDRESFDPDTWKYPLSVLVL